jgi:hypothetical protein
MSVQNLSFARLSPKKPPPLLFLVTDGGKRRQDVLPASVFPVFGISPFFSCFESEIRAGIILQEELVGGRPHHCLRRVRRPPAVGRAQLKRLILVMTMPKNNQKQLSLCNKPFSRYVALRICFLTHLIETL